MSQAMSRPKCHRSVVSLKSFFAVLQSRLHKEFWLLIYPVKNNNATLCLQRAALHSAYSSYNELVLLQLQPLLAVMRRLRRRLRHESSDCVPECMFPMTYGVTE